MSDITCHNCIWNGRDYICSIKFDEKYRGVKKLNDLEDWEVRKIRCNVQSLYECEIYLIESKAILGR